MKHESRGALSTIAGTATLLLLTQTQAAAAELAPPSSEDSVANLIEDVAPRGMTIERPDVRLATGALATRSGTTLPGRGGGVVEVGASGVKVSIPGDARSNAALASDGTVVYEGSEVTVAAQANRTGVRLQTVVEDANTEHTFKYGLQGAEPVLRDDGGVDLVVTEEVGGTTVMRDVGEIDAPWAVDADGEMLDTWYEVDGNDLTQIVEPNTRAVYPVVADPKITIYARSASFLAYFNYREAQQLALTMKIVGYVAAGAGCAYYGNRVARVPGLKTMVSWACGAFSVPKVVQFLRSANVWSVRQYSYAGCWIYSSASRKWTRGGTSACLPTASSWRLQLQWK